MSKNGSKRSQIELRTFTSARVITQHLQEVLEGLESGVLTIERGEERLTLMPPEAVEMRFEAQRKGEDERIALELRWKRLPTDDEGRSLRIRSEHSDVDEGDEEVLAVETETETSSGGSRSGRTKRSRKRR